MRIPFALLIAFGGAGCDFKQSGPTDTPPEIAALSDLKPDALVEGRATLAMGSMKSDVEIRSERVDDKLRIDLLTGGEVLETEEYLVTGHEMLLSKAAYDQYRPPLPLLTFPLRLAHETKWEGELVAGVPRKASATITCGLDKLFIPTPQEAVRVDVVLLLDTGANELAKRKLAFWFVKDKGLLKREFGEGLTREPLVGAE